MASGGVAGGPGKEYQATTPQKSVPPVGLSTVTNAVNPATGRYEVFRDGFRIAVAKTASHAAELSSHAALQWPNPYQAPRVTSYEPPAGA